MQLARKIMPSMPGPVIQIAVLLCALTMWHTPLIATAATSGTIVGTAGINVRACAALDCQVIGAAMLGETVDITGEPVNGFYPVTWFGQEGFVYSLFVTTSDGEAPHFVEGDRSCNQIALVFNIGIGGEPSQTVYDSLVQTDTPATMFPMGWWAREHPDYLRQLDAAGFAIGTHGDQPLILTQQADETITADVEQSVATIESVLGREIDEYFTPYAAESDPRVRMLVSEIGLLPVGWNVTANDYADDATESGVYARIMDGVYPGAVVEMHLDGPATERSTALALPRLIADLELLGYEFVTIPDLLIPCESSAVG